MSQVATLLKILQIKEQEMLDVQREHAATIEAFESVATRLYELLKKKESAETTYEAYIQETTSIENILEQMNYIDSLNKQIISVQKAVNRARDEMNIKQEELTSAHVEMKKYESIIEKRKKEHAEIVEKSERSFMDEISMQQYLNQKGGTYG